MSKFVASKRLSKLEFDFGTDFSPNPASPLRGLVPEPAPAAITLFEKTLANGLESIGYEQPVDADREARLEWLIRTYARLTISELDQLHGLRLDAITEVTQNVPAREDLEQLGGRALHAFQEWLQKELTDPEAPTLAS